MDVEDATAFFRQYLNGDRAKFLYRRSFAYMRMIRRSHPLQIKAVFLKKSPLNHINYSLISNPNHIVYI